MTTLVGTLPWQAPELLRGDHDYSGFSIDLFSFGIIASEVITRKRPYADAPHLSAFQLRDRVLAGLRPTVDAEAHVAQGIPAGCLDSMRQCWRHAPQDRPCIEEVVRALAGMTESTHAGTVSIVQLHLALVGVAEMEQPPEERVPSARRQSGTAFNGDASAQDVDQLSQAGKQRRWPGAAWQPSQVAASWEAQPLLLPCFRLGSAHRLSQSLAVRLVWASVVLLNLTCGIVASQSQARFEPSAHSFLIVMFVTLCCSYSLTVILQLKPKRLSDFRWEPVASVFAIIVISVIAWITSSTALGLELFLDMVFVMAFTFLHGAFRDATTEIQQCRRLARVAHELQAAGRKALMFSSGFHSPAWFAPNSWNDRNNL